MVVDHRPDRPDLQPAAPAPRECRRGTPTTRRAAVRPRSRGVVRASSSIRSECSTRDVQTFWPLTTQPSPSRTAVVRMRLVSVPLVGSVTPNACRRSAPRAICRQKARLLRRRAVPQKRCPSCTSGRGRRRPLQPLACTSSRIAAAAARPRPLPPYSAGISAARKPASVSAPTKRVRIGRARHRAPASSCRESRRTVPDGGANVFEGFHHGSYPVQLRP